jgi:uncharacterized protein YeaO (DUF488 family)
MVCAAADAPSTRVEARCRGEHLRELPHRKKMLTLLTATKDIDISEAAVLAKLVLS